MTPVVWTANISAANANRDGTGDTVAAGDGGPTGVVVHRITVTAQVTTTAGMVRAFSDGLGNKGPIREYPVAAVTVGANTRAWTYTDTEVSPEMPMMLAPNEKWFWATHNAEAMTVRIEGWIIG